MTTYTPKNLGEKINATMFKEALDKWKSTDPSRRALVFMCLCEAAARYHEFEKQYAEASQGASDDFYAGSKRQAEIVSTFLVAAKLLEYVKGLSIHAAPSGASETPKGLFAITPETADSVVVVRDADGEEFVTLRVPRALHTALQAHAALSEKPL